MCRLNGCREPARVSGPKPSKYCSDAHGEEFMAQRAFGKVAKGLDKSANKRRRRDNYTDHTGNSDDANQNMEDSGDAHLRGGLLTSSELKALANGVKDVDGFRQLGDRISNTPPTTTNDDDEHASKGAKFPFTAEEQAQVSVIQSQRSGLNEKKEMLDAKEKLLSLVKARAKSVLEELNKKEKMKDMCGYDTCLSWSDSEFNTWRLSPTGQKAFETGKIGPTDLHQTVDEDGDEKMDSGADADSFARGVCLRKRCERHKQWAKVVQSEIAFEREECRRELQRLAKEETGFEECAILRHLSSKETSGDVAVGPDIKKQ
jgi:COMPASS component SPP1